MFVSVEQAIAAIAAGRVVILTDDEKRENEGDLICAGAFATPENINFLLRYGRGVLCAPVSPEVAVRLSLAVPAGRHDPRGTAFTQSLDAVEGNTTGVSAFDRSRTILAMLRKNSGEADFYSPGHVFPLLGRPGGVLERDGHTEGTLDLVRLAGLPPVGVLCEILKEDGSMARLPDLEIVAEEHHLPMVSIAALTEYRRSRNC